MYLSAILLAAGRGLRFSGNSHIPKLLAEINSTPIIIHSLETLNSHPLIKDIVLVVNSENSKAIVTKIKQYHINKVKRIVKGGLRRQDSVCNGLKAIALRSDFVLIHDAARPFIDKGLVSSLINTAKKNGAAILGLPVKATIKKIKNQKSKIKIVDKTLNRASLWEIQTPQVFRKNLILKAYKKFAHIDATDDAMLVEKLGAKINIVPGSYNNIKITTPEDLVIAEAIYNLT